MQAPAKTRFKKTPIGEIPEDWRVVELGNSKYFEVIMGQSPPSSSYNQEGRGMPFIQGAAEFGHVYVTPKLFTTKPLKIAKKGDILISVRAPVGEMNIAPFDLCIGRGVAAIRPNPKKVDVFFLYYRMSIAKEELERFGGGAVFKAITKNTLKSFKIPLPPLPEQKKIAEILRTVDDAIEKTDKAIERTERLKKGLMQRLLTRGIKHERFKKTEIGEIPEEWRVVRIKDTGKVITGKTPPTSEARYWNGRIPFITPVDIGDAPYVYTTNRYVSKEGAEKVGSLLPKDTVLVVCIGSTIGKVALTYQESITNQQINAIICKENVNPHYLYYTLLFQSKRLKSWSGTAAVPIIKKSLFEKFKIPLPPLEEQKQIAEILSTVDKKLELLRKRKEKLERIKKGLMKDLLTGRRRVKV